MKERLQGPSAGVRTHWVRETAVGPLGRTLYGGRSQRSVSGRLLPAEGRDV